jgi:hypothetical protein
MKKIPCNFNANLLIAYFSDIYYKVMEYFISFLENLVPIWNHKK